MTAEQLSPSAKERQLIGLSTLLFLEEQIRTAADTKAFSFKVVNDTIKLIQYQQAVLCQKKTGNRIKILAVSGVDRPNRNAPYLIWLNRLFKHLLKSKSHDTRTLLEITREMIPQELTDGWDEWGRAKGLWCPLIAPDDEMVGVLWLVRDDQWQTSEKALTEKLARAYAHAWQPLIWRSAWRRAKISRFTSKIFYFLFFCAAMACLCLPVPLTVLAPARIVPLDPVFMTAPQKGVIQHIAVRPNQNVSKGQLLFTLDDTELKNRFQVALKALDVARAEYKRALQKSLIDNENAFDNNILKVRVDQKQAEVNYIQDELNRVSVHACNGGIVLFSNPNDWIGKPVQTGEKIMTLADPAQSKIKIYVPVDNGVNLKPGTKIKLFLNSDPLSPITGTIEQTAYEAQKSPKGILSFPVTAFIVDGKEKGIIGREGTAKIYGHTVRLYYYLFRKPLAAVRRTIGI